MCARMWTCATRLLALVCVFFGLGLSACEYNQEEIAYYKSQPRDGRILGDWLTCDKATGQPDGEYTYRYLANGEFWKLDDGPPAPPDTSTPWITGNFGPSPRGFGSTRPHPIIARCIGSRPI